MVDKIESTVHYSKKFSAVIVTFTSVIVTSGTMSNFKKMADLSRFFIVTCLSWSVTIDRVFVLPVGLVPEAIGSFGTVFCF